MTSESRYAPEPDIAWILPRLAIGSLPYALHRPFLVERGIQVVVSVADADESEVAAWQRLGVEFISMPTRDWVAIPLASFDQVVETVCRQLDRGSTVLLHCLAGINRAPTLAAAILCHREQMSVDQALEAVREARPAARPTPEQEASLRQWLRLRRPARG